MKRLNLLLIVFSAIFFFTACQGPKTAVNDKSFPHTSFKIMRGTNLGTGFHRAMREERPGRNSLLKKIFSLLIPWDLTISVFRLMRNRCGMRMKRGMMMLSLSCRIVWSGHAKQGYALLSIFTFSVHIISMPRKNLYGQRWKSRINSFAYGETFQSHYMNGPTAWSPMNL